MVAPRLTLLIWPDNKSYYELKPGQALGGQIMALSANRWNGREVSVYHDGLMAPEDVARHIVCEGESFAVLVTPAGGVAAAFAGLPLLAKIGIGIAVSTGISYATNALLGREPPGFENPAQLKAEEDVSANRFLSVRQNAVRIGGRIPDVYGRRTIYPDFISSIHATYASGYFQEVDVWFALGMGNYQIDKVRIGESEFPAQNVEWEIYESDEVPNEIIDADALGEIGTVDLVGPGANDFQDLLQWDYTSNKYPGGDGVKHWMSSTSMGGDPILGLIAEQGDIVRVTGGGDPEMEGYWTVAESGTYLDTGTNERGYIQVVEPYTTTGFTNPAIDVAKAYAYRQFLDTKFDGDTIDFPDQSALITVGDLIREVIFGGTDVAYVITGVVQYEDSTPVVGGNIITRRTTLTVTNLDGTNPGFPTETRASTVVLMGIAAPVAGDERWSGWYTLPNGADARYGQFDIQCPAGLWELQQFVEGNNVFGGRQSTLVDFEIEWRYVTLGVPGAETTASRRISGNFSTECRFSLYTDVLSPGGADEIQVRIRRLTEVNAEPTASVRRTDESRLLAVVAVRYLAPSSEWAGFTKMLLKVRNTSTNEEIQVSNVNVDVTRILPTWDIGGQQWLAPAPTRRMADALVDTWKQPEGAAQTDATIDLDGLYAIQGALDLKDGGEEGWFDYSFDSKVKVEEQLSTIANAARCIIYRDGGLLRIARDEIRSSPGALFTTRNKRETESKTMLFKTDSTVDSVIVTWDDPSIGYRPAEIIAPDPAATPDNPARITLQGVTTELSAWRRAQYEYLLRQYRVDDLELNVTEEGVALDPLAMIEISDNLLPEYLSGEVVSYAAIGPVLVIDKAVPTGLVGLSVTLRDPTGTETETIAVAQYEGKTLTLAAPVTIALLLDKELTQVRTLYNLAVEPERDRYTVLGMQPGGDSVRLALTAYNDAIYANDNSYPP